MTHFLDTAAVAWLTIGVVILAWFIVSVTVAAFTRARDVIDSHGIDLTPREGDIVRTSDGQLWRVTSTHDDAHVADVTRLGEHLEMAIQYDGLTVVEPHPGGPR